jgi:hypothetical protein
MSVDLKTSILVNRQVPEFVRDEYPKFVAFLEAYYEFLETQANTSISSNNLVTTAKTLRNIRDVDDSLDRFEKNFYNTYATLIPLEVQSNKALLFKHLSALYRAKGSEGSFKLLFQLIFGEDIDIILPKNNVLRSSASKWQIDNIIRINPDIFTRYVGNGTNKTFYLAQRAGQGDIDVYVNDVLKVFGQDYFINKEYRQLNFVTAPANNAIISVNYGNFEIKILNNRKISGVTSNASAIIETSNKRIISDTLNLGLPIELSIDLKTLDGDFLNGEEISIPINDEVNNISIDVRASTFSIVRKFNVINAGNNYSVGDIVTVSGGNASTNAFGTIESVFTGQVDSVNVIHGGAVFTVSSPISVSGNDALTTMIAVVDGIDTSGANAANSFKVSPDAIANLNIQSAITNSNFGSAFSKPLINAANSISDALNYISFQVGPISNVKVLVSTVPLTERDVTILDAAGAEYGSNTGSAGYRYSKSLKSVGRYKINDGGTNYQIGDEIIFSANPPGTYGQMAAATVGRIAANGYILRIDSANSRIRGTGTVLITQLNEIVGTGTFFTQDLKIGDKVDINNESRTVSSITSDSVVVVNSNFVYPTTNKKIGVYDRWPLGGYGYTQGKFPNLSVSSTTGSGANVQIDSLIGDGESLIPTGFGSNGQIISIAVIDPGSGYEYNPIVNISGGDGTATANAEIERSFASAPGRWTTSDSIISSFERKLQGEDFYIDYSYVISSRIEFSKYKSLLKQLLHPVGLINYAYYNRENVVELTDVSIQGSTSNTISGTVNVGNGRIVVTGTNTKYNIANTKGILSLGSLIAVDTEVRKINTIVSNTTLITTSNIANLLIANAGSGYSNGYLIFANGGGQITSLTVTANGSGYENGVMTFSGTDEAIPAVANVEVHASNGAIRTVTLISGGLYANAPFAIPDSNPHRVVLSNSISIISAGEGYSNGFLIFSGGTPSPTGRDANVSVEVYPSNGSIRSFTVNDPGLYQSNPTAKPDSNANVVISSVVIATGVTQVTANAGRAVNSFIVFSNSIGDTYSPANARVYVNTAGFVENVQVFANGSYALAANITANIAGLRYVENNQVFDATTNSQSNVSLTVGVSNRGNAFSNTVLTLSGGTPGRNARVRIETFPQNSAQVVSIIANASAHGVNSFVEFSGGGEIIPANARIYVTSTGQVNGVVILNSGLYRGTPTANANIGNASLTLSMMSLDGQVRKIIIEDSGLYQSTPTGTLNTTPNSVISVSSNTVANTFVGRHIANGYLIFEGGTPVRTANATYQVYPANGVINMQSIVITDAGLYRSPPTAVRPNITPVSITEVRPLIGGSGYVNGNLVFSTTQATSNLVANCTVEVNGAFGAIVKTTMIDVGLYANSSDIIIVGVLDPTTATLQSPSIAANFLIQSSANRTNVANLIVSTTANTTQTAFFAITANSNSRTNAVFTVTPFANAQTVTTISVGFTGRNTAANAAIEVYPYKVNSISANAGGRAVNSFISFYTNNGTEIEAANARVYVNTAGYVINVTVAANGSYSNSPIANIAGLRYSENNQVFDATTNGQSNVVFTVSSTGNGAIRKVTLNSNGEYYYTPDVRPNSAGANAVFTFNPVSWYKTANTQTAVIIKQ